MSLPLADQKLGSHSNTDSTSHKFMLKGRQSGGMHKSHAWVFRAESYDTMMAWYSDIKSLTEKTGIERDAFIRRTHARSVSAGSHNAGSISEGSALDEDEADQVPYSATASQAEPSTEKLPQRPNPGGRFPSLLSIRDSQAPVASSSPSENSGDRELLAAAGALPGSGVGNGEQQSSIGNAGEKAKRGDLDAEQPTPVTAATFSPDGPSHGTLVAQRHQMERHDSKYGDWMSPAAAGASSTQPQIHGQAQEAKQQEEQPALQAVEMPTSKDSPKNGMTPNAQAAVQLSTFNMPTISCDAPSSAAPETHGTDLAAPIKNLSDKPSLESRASVTSEQVRVPGGYPPSRTSTQLL